MSDQPYKLQVKIGAAEFTAEGPEDTVREAFRLFVETATKAAASSPQQSSVRGGTFAAAGSGSANGTTGTPPNGAALLPRETLDQLFKMDGNVISLRHNPPTANKIADAAVVILYAYKAINGVDEVPVMRLNEGVRRSGLNLERLDREIGPNAHLIRKGGQRAGARFSLNNQGIKQAEAWIQEWTEQ